MEHYIYFGLAVVAFGLLLLTIGPRIANGNGKSYSPPYSDKGYHPKKQKLR
ncbi:MAG: hypothetical protein AAFZ15_06780 [Bacteroidota bacterium]